MIGRVTYCNSRGFGFVQDERLIDFYFHHTQFDGNWKHLLVKFVAGTPITVEFDNDDTAKESPRAKNVRILGE